MPLFNETITGDGIALENASVTIYDSTGLVASIFSDMAMTIPLANPVLSDVNGLISCYMANGNYRLIADKAGYSQRIVDIGFFPILQNDFAERIVNADFLLKAAFDVWGLTCLYSMRL